MFEGFELEGCVVVEVDVVDGSCVFFLIGL